MENYIAAFKEGRLDAQDLKILGDNIPDLHLDINQGFNPEYSNLYIAIFGRNQTHNGNLRFFDSLNVRKIIESKIRSPHLEILLYRFGLYDGKIYTLDEASEKIGTYAQSREKTRQMEFKAIRLLKSPMCARKLANIYDDSLIDIDSLTPEEQSIRNSLLDRIYGSNIIFVPDEEFAQEPDDLTVADLQEISSKLCSIKEHVSQRKRQAKTSPENLPSDTKRPTADLEELRIRKEALEKKLAEIRAKNHSSDQLLNRFGNTTDKDVKGE